jgi:hypothetical protein
MSRQKVTTRYEGRFWASIADNDYQMKSCIMAKIRHPTITGSYLQA